MGGQNVELIDQITLSKAKKNWQKCFSLVFILCCKFLQFGLQIYAFLAPSSHSKQTTSQQIQNQNYKITRCSNHPERKSFQPCLYFLQKFKPKASTIIKAFEENLIRATQEPKLKRKKETQTTQ